MNYSDIKNILTLISDPVFKLETIMDLGNKLPDIPENALCTDILGCASRVKICRVGNHFYGDADSALVRGIVVIIISMVNGNTSSQIKDMDLRREFASLDINLGMGRMNGINSMINFLENL